jgi:hypothetical protein
MFRKLRNCHISRIILLHALSCYDWHSLLNLSEKYTLKLPIQNSASTNTSPDISCIMDFTTAECLPVLRFRQQCNSRFLSSGISRCVIRKSDPDLSRHRSVLIFKRSFVQCLLGHFERWRKAHTLTRKVGIRFPNDATSYWRRMKFWRKHHSLSLCPSFRPTACPFIPICA